MKKNKEKFRLNIRNLSINEIEEWVLVWGYPKFRAKQIFHWLWDKSCRSFEEMVNLPGELKELLLEHWTIDYITMDCIQISGDGTQKIRFRLIDGFFVEAVLIPVPEDGRFTICVSTQVGCSLTCKFCATGQMKRERNLYYGEIVDQVEYVENMCQDTYGEKLTNIVYMGMGEPLLNYKNTVESIHILHKHRGYSYKRITISTAGLSKMIRKLADEGLKCHLALSLHAATDQKRDLIMPINEQNEIFSLTDSLKYFIKKAKTKVSLEYIALGGFNLTEDDAFELASIARKLDVMVNIIEYNTVEGVEFVRATDAELNAFVGFLVDDAVTVTVRRSRGKDIDAACGQLANK